MLIDMHTHTCRYSPCSSWTPAGMVEAAIESGLHGMVITEHDTLWSKAEIQELQERFPQFKLFRGVEVSTQPEDHFLVYGITDPEVFRRGMSTRKLLNLVAERNGFVALAHAYRYSEEVPPEIFELPLHALEGISSNIPRHLQERIQLLAAQLGLPLIAGSDGHTGETVGMFATEFFDDVGNESELVAALKSGRFRIYRHPKKVEAANKRVAEKAKLAQGLIKKGYSLQRIHLDFGIPYALLQGLARGLDVQY